MIEDSRGNQFEGDLSSLFKQMSGKTVSQPVPDANKGKDNSAAYKEMGDLLKKLNANFNTKELSSAINHLNSVVNMAKSSQTNLKQTLSGEFKSIDNSLSKMLGGFGSLQNSLDRVGNTVISSLGRAMGNSGKGVGGDLKNITNTLAGLAKDMASSIKSSRSIYLADNKGTSNSIRDIAKSGRENKGIIEKNLSSFSELAEHGLKPGSIYTHDIHQEEYNKKLIQLMEALNNKILTKDQFENYAKHLNETTNASTKFLVSGYEKGSRSMLGGLSAALKSGSRMVGKVADKTEQFGDVLSIPGRKEIFFQGKSLKEAAKEQHNIYMDAKKIAYETQGIVNAEIDVKKQLMLQEDVSARTGMQKVDVQKQLLEFQKKGIKDQSTLRNIMVAQLNIEKQLGMEAGELGDDFIKLHQQAGFTNIQINSTARGMLDVARHSGLSGKELKAAMESSKGIIENMKKAATLTAGAIKNVTTVMAEAQKLGVTEEIGDILGHASSSAKLLLGASNETKNLLYMAAGAMNKTTELQQGTLTRTKAGMKSLGEGMLQIGRQFGLENVKTIEDMEDAIAALSDDQKMQLNIAMKQNIGVELDQFKRVTQGLLKGGETYQDRLKDIQSKLDNAGKLALTNGEIQVLSEQKLQQQRQAGLDVITQFDETIKQAGKSGKNMNQIMEDFGKTVLSDTAKGQELRDAIEAATGKKAAAMTPQEQMQATMAVSMKQLNEKLVKAGLGEKVIDEGKLVAAMQSPKSFRELTQEMQKLDQEVLTKEKASLDVSTNMQLEQMKANEKATTLLMNSVIDLEHTANKNINPTLAVAAQIGALAAEMALNTAATIANTVAAGIDIVRNFKDIGSFFKRGGSAATKGAS